MATIKLESSDKRIFTVDKKIIKFSRLLSGLFETSDEEEEGENIIPIAMINGHILEKIIQWVEYHKNGQPLCKSDDGGGSGESSMERWDRRFLEGFNMSKLNELICGADFLLLQDLVDICCKQVARMIRGKTAEEIREMLKLKNDHTDDDLVRIQEEIEWCDEMDKNSL